MANKPVKYDPKQNTSNRATSNRKTTKSDTEVWKENWEVMKPFVKFGFKSMVIIGGALISVVKLIPTLLEESKPAPKKGGKIIKI